MRVAKALGMSRQECQAKVTSSEFIDWLVFLNDEVNDFHREDYFWAEIAFIMARANSEHPERIEFATFLKKFSEPEEVDQKPVMEERGEYDVEFVDEPTEEELKVDLVKLQRSMDISKQAWGMLAGLSISGDTATKMPNMK